MRCGYGNKVIDFLERQKQRDARLHIQKPQRAEVSSVPHCIKCGSIDRKLNAVGFCIACENVFRQKRETHGKSNRSV
jgi:hypothetical protein